MFQPYPPHTSPLDAKGSMKNNMAFPLVVGSIVSKLELVLRYRVIVINRSLTVRLILVYTER